MVSGVASVVSAGVIDKDGVRDVSSDVKSAPNGACTAPGVVVFTYIRLTSLLRKRGFSTSS